MSKQYTSKYEYYMQQRDKLIKEKEAKQETLSIHEIEELNVRIRTATFEALFHYGL